ncbi:hypothetical protein GGQ97_001671 [Sphingomonas kaistensis]|uniref:DUF4350 domain-containing protein n=1 Tax=Sphingomonas kaistensis TaxID=298708 RepID=A0A7X5Y633_9SPHN|nr:hypothetical protein [Sphingomonas kaistensis]NJC05878.1 hypothetical protein [Sphingomonas kaistensis]
MSGDAVSDRSGPFRQRFMLLLAGLGVLAFVLSLVLGAYAPNLRSGKDGGTHALSNAVIGFSGIVALAEATGRGPVLVRNDRDIGSEDLVVVTPPNGATPLGNILEARGARATLIVMPKWEVKPRQSPKGWVTVDRLLPTGLIDNVLAPQHPVKLMRRRSDRRPLRSTSPLLSSVAGLREPATVQSFSGPGIQPMLIDSLGQTVLGKVGGGNLYLLSDPDLLNNHGMVDKAQAAAALRLLDDLNSTNAEGIVFDLSANGFGGTRNPLQLLFGPPFLGMTLIIFVALLLAGWQAIVRFGSPRLPVRAIGFGKAALIENSAALIRKAGREARFGGRYADLVRDQAAALFRLPAQLAPAELDATLDRLRPDRPFSDLARAVEDARTRHELTVAARALNRWLQETRT